MTYASKDVSLPLYRNDTTKQQLLPQPTHLVVVWAVGGFLHGCVFLLIADLHTHYRIHVKAGQLPRLYDGQAYLQQAMVTCRGRHTSKGWPTTVFAFKTNDLFI